MLFVVCGSLFDVRRVLSVVCCWFAVVYLVVVGWMWCFVCCFAIVACCSWFVAYLFLVVLVLLVGCVIGGRW